MTAHQLRLALTIAQDKSLDLSREFHDTTMDGFGLKDFQPVMVSLRMVAGAIRWQCCCFDGSFDWKQFNEDRPHYLRKEIQIADLDDAELRAWLITYVQRRLAGEHPTELAA